jgi:3-carboxy-cis,cis-muconate cycloisomerase
MLLDTAMFGSPRMAAVFSTASFVARMLAFEGALAHAEAEAGVIPAAAGAAIAAACSSGAPEWDALAGAAASAGTPVIPLVAWLTDRVASEGKGYVHWGATSQDTIDTALVLQVRDGLDLLLGALGQTASRCADLARTHRRTLMAGRTLLQQALPISFGLKAARWLALICRQIQALRRVRRDELALQFGGAAGTLAALGERGMQVSALLARELRLPEPELPWHSEQDRPANVACVLGVLAGAMGKIAADLILLAQTEIGEVSEGPGQDKEGSSAMPQKRNPVDSMEAAAAARLALGLVPVVLAGMVQEHERAAGAWQAGWSALPSLFCSTAGAVEHVGAALSGLEVDCGRMDANLAMTNGLIMSEALVMVLAPQTGRDEAQRIVRAVGERAASDRQSLRDAALDDERVCSRLTPEAITSVLDPRGYLGSTDAFINRALSAFERL